MLVELDIRVCFIQYPPEPKPHPNPPRVKIAIGALTGVITGLCLAGPLGAIAGGAIGGFAAWIYLN